MSESPRAQTLPPPEGNWLDRLVHNYPATPYVAPFMTFLVLMALGQFFPGPKHVPWLYTLRTAGALIVTLMFWRFFPRLGKPHFILAIIFGLLTTVMWVGVHHWFADQSWYHLTQRVGRDPRPDEFYNPFEQLGHGLGVWLFLFVRIGGAAIVVPIIEEIFWRGFLLRLFVDRWEWDKVPLGTFTWTSYLVVSALSAMEHPQWEVGILCWLLYNALFYWKKSLLFLIITHGITNLTLYIYVVVYQDWIFW